MASDDAGGEASAEQTPQSFSPAHGFPIALSSPLSLSHALTSWLVLGSLIKIFLLRARPHRGVQSLPYPITICLADKLGSQWAVLTLN